MKIVLDANVLFRILISEGSILEIIYDDRIQIYAPEKLKEEFFNHQEEILQKSSLSQQEFEIITSTIFEKIKFISIDKYKTFIPKAKQLLSGHEKDEDFIALCKTP